MTRPQTISGNFDASTFDAFDPVLAPSNSVTATLPVKAATTIMPGTDTPSAIALLLLLRLRSPIWAGSAGQILDKRIGVEGYATTRPAV